MNWLKKQIGLDWFDLLLHATITGAVMGLAESSHRGDGPVLGVFVVSLVVLGLRRHFAFKRQSSSIENGLTSGQMAAARLDEVEQRLTELDAANVRIAELEERLDFTERLLAQVNAAPRELPR
ncbi:MAG: hypothetical protein ABI647_19415 [Gemmatimonadota bacterium]